MKRKTHLLRTVLSVLLSLLLIGGCFAPAYAMEMDPDEVGDERDIVNEVMYGSSADPTIEDQLNVIKSALMHLQNRGDQQDAAAAAAAAAAANDWTAAAGSVLNTAMSVVKNLSSVISLVNGTVNMLKTFGVIKDKSANTQRSILEGLNSIQLMVDKIDRNIDSIQETLISEFSELDLKFQEQEYNHYKDDVWGRFYTDAVQPLLALQNEYSDDVNWLLVGYIEEWLNGSGSDLRALYGEDGQGGYMQVYSAKNLGDAGDKLPKQPRVSVDPIPVNYAVTLPASYISDNMDLTRALSPDNCVTLLTEALEKGVYAAAENGELAAYGGFDTVWKYLSEEEKLALAEEFAADLTDALLFAASYSAANERKFAASVRSAYESFTKWLAGTESLTSPMYAQLKMLSLTHGFEGEIREDAYTLFGYLQLMNMNFAAFTETVLSMSKAHTADDCAAVSRQWTAASDNLGRTCRDFITGSANYCYILGKTLEYRDVEISSSVTVNAVASFSDTAKTRYRNFYYDGMSTTPWIMWEKDLGYSSDAANEKQTSFSRLKQQMISSKEAALLYAMFEGQTSQKTFAEYLTANNAAVSADDINKEMITSFYASDFDLSKGILMNNVCAPTNMSDYVETGDIVRVNVGIDDDMENSGFLLHDAVTGGHFDMSTGKTDENTVFAARAFYEEDATWSGYDEAVFFSDAAGECIRTDAGDGHYTYTCDYYKDYGAIISVPVKTYTFPADTQTIGSSYFGTQMDIEKLTFLGTPSEIAGDAFNGVGMPDDRCLLTVPAGFETGSLSGKWHGGYFGDISVVLDKNDGSGEKKDTAAVKGEPCNTMVLPFEAPEYKKFAGWALSSTAAGPIDNTETLTDGMILYAVWEYDHAHDFEVTGERAATCTMVGASGKKVCRICGYTEANRILRATGHSCEFTKLAYGSWSAKCRACGTTLILSPRQYGDLKVYGYSLSPVIVSLSSDAAGKALNISQDGVFVIENNEAGKTTSQRIVIKDNVSANILFAGVDIQTAASVPALAVGTQDTVRFTLADGSVNSLVSGVSGSGITSDSPFTVTGGGSLIVNGKSAPAIDARENDVSILGGCITAASDVGFAGLGSRDADPGSALLTVSENACFNAELGTGYKAVNEDGEEICLLKTENDLGKAITVDGESYPFTAAPDDTAASLWLTCEDHTLTVGEETRDYIYEDGCFMLTRTFDDLIVTYPGADAILYAGGVLTVKTDKPVTVRNRDPEKPTDNVILVNYGVNADITLAGVNIQADNSPALRIADNSPADVKITLAQDSENKLVGAANCAGIGKNGLYGTLTISGEGALDVTGGLEGAGIGSDKGQKTHGITINSGTVRAVGGTSGAGIGSGHIDTPATAAEYAAEGITVNGGRITAESVSGAGIGSGACPASGTRFAAKDLTINGGTVIASTIGGGVNSDAENIRINGGVITTSPAGALTDGIGAGGRLTGLVITPMASVKSTLGAVPVNADGKEVTLNTIGCDVKNAVVIDGVQFPYYDHNGEAKIYVYLYGYKEVRHVPRIMVGDCENGTVTADKTAAAEGETVRLSVKPAEGYVFIGFTSDPGLEIKDGSFVMPADPVTVGARFGRIGTVTVKACDNCEVTPSGSIAAGGDKITLRVVPAEGARFEKWVTEPAGLVITNNTFIMPEEDVVITPVFVVCEHTFDEGVQTDDAIVYTCTECGYTLTHSHTFSETWSSNEEIHWHAATCGHMEEISCAANHTWSDGIVIVEPTDSSTGLTAYVCTVCGAVRNEITDERGFFIVKPDDPSAAILYGDIDDNGVVDAADARLALRISVRLDTPNAKQKKAGDVDFNGAIDAADARRILRASVRLEDPLSWTKE